MAILPCLPVRQYMTNLCVYTVHTRISKGDNYLLTSSCNLQFQKISIPKKIGNSKLGGGGGGSQKPAFFRTKKV